MTKIASMTPPIPRVIGVQPTDEATILFKCDEACGPLFDMRDLGAVLDHEGPLPHPAIDQTQ